MEPNEQQIREAIDKSGYLFESQIGYLLREKDYLVTPNYNFEDAETGDSREIDLHAILGYFEKDLEICLEQLLLIECKKTSNPLVFFSKPKYKELKGFDEYFEIIGAPESFDVPRIKGVTSLEKYLKLSEFSHRYKLANTSSQFCMICRKGKEWEAQHGPVYNGMIVPLIKCLSSEKKRYRKSIPKNYIHLEIIYPIVVVDSALYLMNSETNEMKRKKWILFYRQYESKKVKLSAMIDFVQCKHINTYLKEINTSFAAIRERVIKRRKILLDIIKTKKFYMGD